MFLFFRRRPRPGAVARDVERMLGQYGPEAYRIAGEMSWREDAGLLMAPDDGHWHRVHIEIGRRIGRTPPTWTHEPGLAVGRGSTAAPAEVPDPPRPRGRDPEPRSRVTATAEC